MSMWDHVGKGIWDDDNKGGIWAKKESGGLWGKKSSGGLWSKSNGLDAPGMHSDAFKKTTFGGSGIWNPRCPWTKR